MAPGIGAGLAAADFDDDGDIDLFVPNGPGVPDQLYVNTGTGAFAERASQLGVASLEGHRAALWMDYDGDHLLDLIVAGDCADIDDSDCRGTIILYRQTPEGPFENTTAQAGELRFSDPGQIGGMAAGDINGDGFLDLVLCSWRRAQSKFYLNNGDGTFADISVSTGIAATDDRLWQPLFHDFNGDGRQDLFIAVDFSADRLWINQGNNTFVDEAPAAGLDFSVNEMGIAAGDYDNDEDIDLYVTNVPGANHLSRNDGAGALPLFTDIAEDLGVNSTGWAWGCTFVDANNDGLLDLAATNGYFESSSRPRDPSAFFLNRGGDPIAVDLVSDEVGFNDLFWGSCLITIDYDRDGRMDLLQTTRYEPEQESLLRLLRNIPDPAESPAGFLHVRPRQDGPNHRAIGAIVRVTTGATTMTRLITAGASFIGQEPAEAHFGLGDATQADALTVEWPDGAVSRFEDITANQLVTATKDGFTAVLMIATNVNRDAAVNAVDVQLVINAALGLDISPVNADVDKSGVTDAVDVQLVINAALDLP
jgi:hypothetical protein